MFPVLWEAQYKHNVNVFWSPGLSLTLDGGGDALFKHNVVQYGFIFLHDEEHNTDEILPNSYTHPSFLPKQQP